MKTIIFSHGKESGPTGRKIQALSDIAKINGFKTLSIDYTQIMDPEERVLKLEEQLKDLTGAETIMVGSSMGAYVSATVAQEFKPKGLFLMSPAFYLPKYKVQNFKLELPISIIHGWNDDVVPYVNSIKFGNIHKTELHLIKDNHRLMDSISFVESLFLNFITKTFQLKK